MSNAKRGLIALVCVLWASSVEAQIVIQASATADASSVSITPAGSNRLLLLFIGSDTATVQTCTTVVFNTTETMTAVTGAVSNGTGQYIQAYYLINPSAVTANASASGGTCSLSFAQAIALSGVDQTTPWDSVQVGTQVVAGPATTAAVSSAAGDLVISAAGIDGKLIADITQAGTGQTAIVQDDNAGAYQGTAQQAGAGSVTPSYSWATGNRRTTALGFNINAVAAAGGCTGGLTLLGAGKCD